MFVQYRHFVFFNFHSLCDFQGFINNCSKPLIKDSFKLSFQTHLCTFTYDADA